VRRTGPDAATVALQPVVTGGQAGARVEVTQGLAPGDEVVVRGVNSLTEGQQVGRKVNP
ncbi:MAG TPA: efflux RND transporter periplasmic adaptor subunit, partial [Paracoccus sp.]|nr:efflux RND transporter periplasmic adaptor subunit [Paracoccus sp. (in: a-proteobacteria)]